jgi:hypothetical protein
MKSNWTWKKRKEHAEERWGHDRALFIILSENHRTQNAWEMHLMIKMAVVEFVNLFSSLFYIGFYLQNWDALKLVRRNWRLWRWFLLRSQPWNSSFFCLAATRNASAGPSFPRQHQWTRHTVRHSEEVRAGELWAVLFNICTYARILNILSFSWIDTWQPWKHSLLGYGHEQVTIF